MSAIPDDALDRVFAALADPTRRAILRRLAQGEATVTQLVTPSSLSQPTISKHLKVLEHAGLVERGRDAQFRPVRLNPAPLKAATMWLGDYRRFWEDNLDQLDAYVQTLLLLEPPMTSAETLTVPADLTITLTRVFDAPARLLFLAHSRPEHIRRWFGPRGWPVTHCEMDFRVGGGFRFAMTGPDGVQGPFFGGSYREIVPNRKIVYDNGFFLPDAERMVTTVTFDEDGGRTTLTLRTVFASEAMYREHVGGGFAVGVGSGLDQLGELVAEWLAAGEAPDQAAGR